MAYEQFTNADYTSLTAGYTAGAGTLTVNNSAGENAGFPTVPNFRIRIRNPAAPYQTKARLKVTAIPGGGVTLTTASDGLDANCSIGDVVENVVSKNGLFQLLADGCQEDTYANLSAGVLASNGPFIGATARQSDGPYDWFWNGSIWAPRIAGHGRVTLPPSSGWTSDNLGSSTEDFTYGYQHLELLRLGAVQLRMRYRTAPAPPYTITYLIQQATMSPGIASSTGNSIQSGIGFRDGSGKIIRFNVGYDSGWQMILQKWTSSTSTPSTLAAYGAANTFPPIGSHLLWLRIADNNTNLIFSWSLDGKYWIQFSSQSRTGHFASGPTQYGAVAYCNGDQVTMNVLSIVES